MVRVIRSDVEVLVLVLQNACSWGDLVGAASWVMFAPTEVYVHHMPGYRAARTYALLDRFTRWLHDRGDITSWQRDVMRSEIDAQRGAHFCAMRGVPRLRRAISCAPSRSISICRSPAERSMMVASSSGW